MRKFTITIVAAFLAVFALAACSDGSSDIEVKAAKTASLNGQWKADGFEATVKDNLIEVNIVNADSSSLYWRGTFPVGSETINSVADRKALDESLLGSQDSEKEFTVKDDSISFKITIMGTSKIVHLTKG